VPNHRLLGCDCPFHCAFLQLPLLSFFFRGIIFIYPFRFTLKVSLTASATPPSHSSPLISSLSFFSSVFPPLSSPCASLSIPYFRPGLFFQANACFDFSHASSFFCPLGATPPPFIACGDSFCGLFFTLHFRAGCLIHPFSLIVACFTRHSPSFQVLFLVPRSPWSSLSLIAFSLSFFFAMSILLRKALIFHFFFPPEKPSRLDLLGSQNFVLAPFPSVFILSRLGSHLEIYSSPPGPRPVYHCKMEQFVLGPWFSRSPCEGLPARRLPLLDFLPCCLRCNFCWFPLA